MVVSDIGDGEMSDRDLDRLQYLVAMLANQKRRVRYFDYEQAETAAETLAAAGISGFSSILNVYRDRAPLRRNVEAGEVGEAAAFLLSDAGKGVTGEVLMVDAGFHITGM